MILATVLKCLELCTASALATGITSHTWLQMRLTYLRSSDPAPSNSTSANRLFEADWDAIQATASANEKNFNKSWNTCFRTELGLPTWIRRDVLEFALLEREQLRNEKSLKTKQQVQRGGRGLAGSARGPRGFSRHVFQFSTWVPGQGRQLLHRSAAHVPA